MSTLEEATEADVLLHVSDVSHPQLFEQMAVVKGVLAQLSILDKPTIFVFNKVDLLEHKGLMDRLRNEYAQSVFVSATSGLFLDELKEEIQALSSKAIVTLTLTLGVQDSEIVSKIYELAEVLATDYDEQKVLLTLRATPERAKKIEWLIRKSGEAPELSAAEE